MIYLVSRNRTLFNSDKYKCISCNRALEILEPLSLIQLDTETMGLDCHTKELLTLQLGDKDNQIVFDWTTLNREEKTSIKNLLEDSSKTWLGWNLSRWQLLFIDNSRK